MANFDVIGTGKLIRKATAFRNLDPVLKRHLNKNLRAATEPLKRAIAASARDTLPKSGGLAEEIARSKTSTVSIVGNSAGVHTITGVRLVTRAGHDIKSLDAGNLRHPTYGRKPWQAQTVQSGWWSGPVEKFKPQIQAAALRAVADTAKELSK